MIFLDLLLMVITFTCSFYAWNLGRKIKELVESRIEFARNIKEFDISIAKANKSIENMNEAIELNHRQIQLLDKKNLESNNLIEELNTISDIARNILNRMQKITSAMDIQKSTTKHEQPRNEKNNKNIKTSSINDVLLEVNDEEVLLTDSYVIEDDATAAKFARIVANGEHDEFKNIDKTLKNQTKDGENNVKQKIMHQSAYYNLLKKVSAEK